MHVLVKGYNLVVAVPPNMWARIMNHFCRSNVGILGHISKSSLPCFLDGVELFSRNTGDDARHRIPELESLLTQYHYKKLVAFFLKRP